MGIYATSEMSQVYSVHEHKMALSRALHCSSLLIAALLLPFICSIVSCHLYLSLKLTKYYLKYVYEVFLLNGK
jgi:hypothetical protein